MDVAETLEPGQPALPGQWLGTLNVSDATGPKDAALTINIDPDLPDRAHVLVWPAPGSPLVPAHGEAQVDLKGDVFIARLRPFFPSPPGTLGQPLNGEFRVRHKTTDYTGSWWSTPAAVFSRGGEAAGKLIGREITGIFNAHPIGEGHFSVKRMASSADSEAPIADTKRWSEFRTWALGRLSQKGHRIYRGHRDSTYPLVTTFHRTGRTNLLRYDQDALRHLHRHLEPLLGRSVDLENPRDYGSFLFLAQHHGFPTPLLDWTDSPFVAAFFALEKPVAASVTAVRIFELNLDALTLPPAQSILHPAPTLAAFRFGARDNPRALPQQAVSLFSNFEHIALLLKTLGHAESTLTFDIDAGDRDLALRELRQMGITQASMYPGIDGTCRAVALEHFGERP